MRGLVAKAPATAVVQCNVVGRSSYTARKKNKPRNIESTTLANNSFSPCEKFVSDCTSPTRKAAIRAFLILVA